MSIPIVNADSAAATVGKPLRDIQEYRDFMVTKLTNLQHIASTQKFFSPNLVEYYSTFNLPGNRKGNASRYVSFN